jgi:ATP/maltotriose-dependent transcriptional regulator MalT
MTEQRIPYLHDEDAELQWRMQAPVVRSGTFMPFLASIGLLDGGQHSDSPRRRQISPEEAVLDTLGRCKPRQTTAGTSLSKIRRDLARTWHLVLALQTDEALRMIERVELQIDDVPPANARRLRRATQLLRAAGLALQDDSLALLPIVVSLLKQGGTTRDDHAALTLCRLGFWRLGEFDSFCSLPRLEPRARWSKSLAISAMLDLSIEAAVALDHLRMSTAKRMGLDALDMAKSAPKEAAGLATVPASIAAQVLYEEGCLDQADTLLRDRLPVINARGPIESALRAYVVLARIARQRKQCDFAALLLREAEALGERRGWPRLVAACLAERASLLLRGGQTQEARVVLEYLERYAESHRSRSGHANSEITRYSTLTRWRVSWAETPSREAVAALRQLYHRALENRDLYVGCGLAVELAEMLAAIEEFEQADALFFHTIKAAAVAGLYQVFLEGGPGSGMLLRRAYARAAAPASMDREVLPFVGSLLSRWDSCHAGSPAEQPGRCVGDTLTARERDVLAMISQGFANKRIARTLEISPETVKSHVKRIFSKLAVSSRTEAVSQAVAMTLGHVVRPVIPRVRPSAPAPSSVSTTTSATRFHITEPPVASSLRAIRTRSAPQVGPDGLRGHRPLSASAPGFTCFRKPPSGSR